jgi:hypothetical protein
MLEPAETDYLNPATCLRLMEWRRRAWNWHGDLFRYTTPSYGPNLFAGFAGGKPRFGATTVWHEPLITSLDESERIHFDEDLPYWKHYLNMVDYFCEACRGVRHLGMTDFGGPADVISVLMPIETFVLSAYDQPDRMRELALRIAQEMNHAFDLVYKKISKVNDGSVNWMPVWADGPMGTVQDDIAILFSPQLYADVFLPAVRVIAGNTERTVLHWHDGCSPHLDNILELKELDVIQYGHDPNTGDYRDKLADMKKIQKAGKHLFIGCITPDEAKYFLQNLDPRGLLMIINTRDDQQSRQVLDALPQWTAQGIH